MPDLIWALPCQHALVDQQTNSVSYINAVEALKTGGFPIVALPVTISTLWRRVGENDKVHQRVRVLSPAGKEVAAREMPAFEFGTFRRFRANQAIAGFEFDRPGDYWYVIENEVDGDWKEVARIPISIYLEEVDDDDVSGSEPSEEE